MLPEVQQHGSQWHPGNSFLSMAINRIRNRSRSSRPLHEAHGTARSRRRAVAGNIIQKLRAEVLQRTRGYHPVQDLASPQDHEPFTGKVRKFLAVSRQETIEAHPVDFLVDDEVAQATGGDDGDLLVGLPAFYSLSQRFSEGIASAR